MASTPPSTTFDWQMRYSILFSNYNTGQRVSKTVSWFEVVVITVEGCNNYLATLLFGASSNILHHFFSAPTFRLFSFTWALQPSSHWQAGWLEQDLHQLSLGSKPVSTTATTTSTATRTRTTTVLLHILYNISRSTARSTTISYTSQSNTLATDFCSKYYLSLSLEIIPAPSHFLLTVLKCLRPPSGAAPMLSLWSKLIRTLTLSLLRSLIELQTIKMPGHSVEISV